MIFPKFKFSWNQSFRYLSSKRDRILERRKAFQERLHRVNGTGDSNPEFGQLIKLFLKRSHPDVIRHSSPQQADINNRSFQQLNEVLSSIKCNEYPNLMNKTLTFYMRNENHSNPGLKEVNLTLVTAGGDSRKALFKSFQAFFYETNILNEQLGERFIWGKDYFDKEQDHIEC